MNTKLKDIGLIGGLVGTAIMGVSAIVAERRRRKAKKELTLAKLNVQVRDLYITASDMEIELLKRELENAKSKCQGGES